MRHTRNPKVVQIGRKGASGQIRELEGLSFFIFIFPPNSPTEVIRQPILTHSGSNYAESRKGVPFRSPHDSRPHLRGQIHKKNLKIGRG